MELPDGVEKVPWDRNEFGVSLYEILSVTVPVLEEVVRMPGHYTVKVDPLSSKEILHDNGFYYCDTLVEPYCSRERFVFYHDDAADVTSHYSLDMLAAMCEGAFTYGRFHRDFNLDRRSSDLRYINWLRELDRAGHVLALIYGGEAAGFLAFSSNRLVLHAVDKSIAARVWQSIYGARRAKRCLRAAMMNLSVLCRQRTSRLLISTYHWGFG